LGSEGTGACTGDGQSNRSEDIDVDPVERVIMADTGNILIQINQAKTGICFLYNKPQ
jgi:hypothetical protein